MPHDRLIGAISISRTTLDTAGMAVALARSLGWGQPDRHDGYAATGLALMLAIVLHWGTDLWHVHAPANAS